MIRTLLVAAALLVPVGNLFAADTAWIEGESAGSNVKPNNAGWGNKAILSGETWLHYAVDADKVEKDVPADGAIFSYKFALNEAGDFDVWDRVGFEFVRSPFSWRIDGGSWTESKPDELTTDLMELDFFCEVAWLKLGSTKLSKGEHSLEIRLMKRKNAQGKPERILYASDALCVAPSGTFRPNGKFKPGDDGRDARDKSAESASFKLPAPKGANRSAVLLKGVWEIARDDEQMPKDIASPMAPLSTSPIFRAIDVPGDKNTLRPELVFAHRVWYRTRVDVPKEADGRSFFLVFPQNNLNTTVYVNGTLCGFDKNPFARLQFDVTKAIKPGSNEIMVGIRDAWYGRSHDPENPMKLRKTFNLPKKFFGDGFQDLAFPIWNLPQSGILVTPELVCAGPVYASDIFVKTSVQAKTLSADLTIAGKANGSAVTIGTEALDEAGNVAHRFREIPLKAGETSPYLTEGWADAKPWWPDSPTMYRLRTTVSIGGKPVDISETPFGFREWSIDGRDFKLNGIPWHGWADTHNEDTPKEWLDFYHKTNQTFMRFWGTSWKDMPPEQALAWFDKSGVVVRRSGILDGEAIGYHAIEQDPKVRARQKSDINLTLLNNWRDQMVAQVKGERNHPSVMIWSIENEYLYINCINLHGDKMDEFEREVIKTSDAVREADPTRPTMTDGGGATKSNRMPVQGDHYTAGKFWEYPTLAYTDNTKGGGRGRWEWDTKRPRFIGEELFAEGFNPAYSYFGGEEVFSGKAGARRSVGLLVRMMTEGARWTGNGAIHFWQGPSVAVGQYDANAPRAVFCREWDWTVESGGSLRRTIGVFDETHERAPIIFRDEVVIGGKSYPGLCTEGTTSPHNFVGKSLTIDPTGQFAVQSPGRQFRTKNRGDLHVPTVTTRTEAEYVMTLSSGGKEIFRDVKPLSILPAPVMPSLKDGELALYDPSRSVRATLTKQHVPFVDVLSLEALPESARILVIGPDAFNAQFAASSKLAAYASGGRRVIVLDQKHPLRYQALGPAEMESDQNEGRIAHVEDSAHPILRGLKSKDFFTWSPGEVVYRNAYLKPTRGARSLVQCHDTLKNSALVEVPIGKGILILSQLRIGETLASNAVARTLLANMVTYANAYKQEFRNVAVVPGGSTRLMEALEKTGLKYVTASDPIAAIIDPHIALVVMDASPESLKMLAGNLERVAKFKARGGYIVLHGLTPEGLESYNTIVGVNHMIRPFRRERVTFPPARDPLGAGLSLGDVALYSSERIFPWQEGNFVASDTFTYVVDYDDVAPFARLFDRDAFAANMVNGFVSSDAWKYIVNLPVPKSGPMEFPLELPAPQTISEVEWTGNTFYYPVTKFSLVFDGKDEASFKVRPINDPQTLAIEPARKGRNITLRLSEWDKPPGKAAVTGLDNIRLKPVRDPSFYAKVKPLVSNGGLVHYPDGPGGVVLVNLNFRSNEDVPGNAEKKRSAFATILRNLRAPFAGGRTIIAGSALDYSPVDLSKQANAYRTDRGWFGDKNATFQDLPTGKQTFAGVPFTVYDFATSPVPTVVMLGGSGVPGNLPSEVKGIPVDRKADALFFLHAARIDGRRNVQEVAQKKRFTIAKYVVAYADGKTLEIPIDSELDVDNYKQKTPSPVPGAMLGWTRPFANSEESAVAYVKPWTNPRPDVAIKSVGLAAGPDKGRGVPALIAITAATSRP